MMTPSTPTLFDDYRYDYDYDYCVRVWSGTFPLFTPQSSPSFPNVLALKDTVNPRMQAELTFSSTLK